MNMTRTETLSASEPRPWASFKASEKAFMIYFSKQGLHFVRGWLQQSENESAIDQTAFGLSTQDMQVLALRVARHLTGAQPIPELSGQARARIDEHVCNLLLKTIQDDLNRLAGAVEVLETSTLSSFLGALQEVRKVLTTAQSRVRRSL